MTLDSSLFCFAWCCWCWPVLLDCLLMLFSKQLWGYNFLHLDIKGGQHNGEKPPWLKTLYPQRSSLADELESQMGTHAITLGRNHCLWCSMWRFSWTFCMCRLHIPVESLECALCKPAATYLQWWCSVQCTLHHHCQFAKCVGTVFLNFIFVLRIKYFVYLCNVHFHFADLHSVRRRRRFVNVRTKFDMNIVLDIKYFVTCAMYTVCFHVADLHSVRRRFVKHVGTTRGRWLLLSKPPHCWSFQYIQLHLQSQPVYTCTYNYPSKVRLGPGCHIM